MNLQQLLKIMPNAPPARIGIFAPHIASTIQQYDIITAARAAAWLAQVAWESGECRYVREIADGTAYEGRRDLGNTQPGDGRRFPGRGLLQITGRANYTACGAALGLDLVNHPELLEQPEHAAMSAGWFWDRAKLNKLADAGDFEAITRRINGGTNGAAQRRQYYQRALQILG